MIPTKENPIGEDVSRKYTPISHVFQKGKHHPMNVQYMTLEENLQKGRREFWLATPGTTMEWWDVIGVGR